MIDATDPDETIGDTTERCDACGTDTPHRVSIELRAESRDPETAPFSREPYRIAECLHCGESSILRMNNA